jgi:hypothetical protein
MKYNDEHDARKARIEDEMISAAEELTKLTKKDFEEIMSDSPPEGFGDDPISRSLADARSSQEIIATLQSQLTQAHERINEARCLLKRAKPDYHPVVNMPECDAWIGRRDAWQKGGGL